MSNFGNRLGFVEKWWVWGIGVMGSVYEVILRIGEGLIASGYKSCWLFNYGSHETKKIALKNPSFRVFLAMRCHHWVANLLPYKFLLLVGLLLLMKKCQDSPLPYVQTLRLDGSLLWRWWPWNTWNPNWLNGDSLTSLWLKIGLESSSVKIEY